MGAEQSSAALNIRSTYRTEEEDLQKYYVLDRLKSENERLREEKEDLQKNYVLDRLKSENERLREVLDSLKRENERLENEASFNAGFCVALVVVVIVLVACIIWRPCHIGFQ